MGRPPAAMVLAVALSVASAPFLTNGRPVVPVGRVALACLPSDPLSIFEAVGLEAVGVCGPPLAVRLAQLLRPPSAPLRVLSTPARLAGRSLRREALGRTLGPAGRADLDGRH